MGGILRRLALEGEETDDVVPRCAFSSELEIGGGFEEGGGGLDIDTTVRVWIRVRIRHGIVRDRERERERLLCGDYLAGRRERALEIDTNRLRGLKRASR